MHGIGHISSHPALQPSTANNAAAPAGVSGGFQLNSASPTTQQIQRVPSASSSLGTNAMSTLLLTQDVGATPHGHGGGKGHGGMKMLSGAAEQTAEAEEAEQMQQRKKLPKLEKPIGLEEDKDETDSDTDQDPNANDGKDLSQHR